jgi:hypothetical protein
MQSSLQFLNMPCALNALLAAFSDIKKSRANEKQ